MSKIGATGKAPAASASMPGGGGAGSSSGNTIVVAGFAKLQGEDFEYYMQTYSITLGRNSKQSKVDVDLASVGGGMNISRHHARIFYDFARHRFSLDVLGKNGCFVEGVLYLPGGPSIKLDSQDLLQIGEKKFYFLLPSRSLFPDASALHVARQQLQQLRRQHEQQQQQPLHRMPMPPQVLRAPQVLRTPQLPPLPQLVQPQQLIPASQLLQPAQLLPTPQHAVVQVAPPPPPPSQPLMHFARRARPRQDDILNQGRGNGVKDGGVGQKAMPGEATGFATPAAAAASAAPIAGSSAQLGRNSETRSRTGKLKLMELEEKDVVTQVAAVLYDIVGPGEWIPLPKLHAKLIDQYGKVWHYNRVRKYLTADECPPSEAKGRPWFSLLKLARKHPELFAVTTNMEGKSADVEFVSLLP